MAIPDYQSFMLPLLQELSDGQPRKLSDVRDTLAKHFNLTEEQQREVLPSGGSFVLHSRVGWARTYLRKAGLIDLPSRGVMQITDRGQATLRKGLPKIDVAYLKKFPEFIEFISSETNAGSAAAPIVPALPVNEGSPEDRIDEAHQEITRSLSTDLLIRVHALNWMDFEQLVVKLLVRMGYGGSVKDAGNALMKSGDEGIDGTIKEDKLGLDVIYIQAKKWQAGNTVGRPEIQKFVGALAGQGAKKGVFITTSTFTKDARDYTPRNDTKVVLIDGLQLAQLIIDHDLGVTTERTYVVKRIDSDFFGEE